MTMEMYDEGLGLEPIAWDHDDETGDEWPVYSEADQARIDAARAERLMTEHIRRMREFQLAWGAQEEAAKLLHERMRRTVLEAQANSRWHYAAAKTPDGANLMERDMFDVRQAELEMQQFFAQHTTSELVYMNMDRAQVSEFKGMIMRDLTHMMQAHVYGHMHEPVEVKGRRTVAVPVPTSWWQMFKRDVLKRKAWKSKDVQVYVGWQVSAARFTAFPELPYVPPKDWGPKLNLVLPRPMAVRVHVEGSA